MLKHFKLDRSGMYFDGTGISMPGLVLFMGAACIALFTGSPWVGLLILLMIPVVIARAVSSQKLFGAPFPHAAVMSAPAVARAEQAEQQRNDMVLKLQHMIDDAGGVPADISLASRVDCLIKQRDGVIGKSEMRHFGKHDPRS